MMVSFALFLFYMSKIERSSCVMATAANNTMQNGSMLSQQQQQQQEKPRHFVGNRNGDLVIDSAADSKVLIKGMDVFGQVTSLEAHVAVQNARIAVLQDALKTVTTLTEGTLYTLCSPGETQVASADENQCVTCPFGTYSFGGRAPLSCRPCPEGYTTNRMELTQSELKQEKRYHAARLPDESQMTECQGNGAGTTVCEEARLDAAAREVCKFRSQPPVTPPPSSNSDPCGPGEFFGSSGVCERCGPGFYKPAELPVESPDFKGCRSCPRDTYSDRHGMETCTPCSPGSRTAFFSVTRSGADKCKYSKVLEKDNRMWPSYRMYEAPIDFCPPGSALVGITTPGTCSRDQRDGTAQVMTLALSGRNIPSYVRGECQGGRGQSGTKNIGAQGGVKVCFITCDVNGSPIAKSLCDAYTLFHYGERCQSYQSFNPKWPHLRIQACEWCPPGKYGPVANPKPTNGDETKPSSVCAFCPKGTYSPESRMRKCLPCPPGTTTAGSGAKSVDECAHLSPKPSGTCPDGTSPVLTSVGSPVETCIKCQPGSYASREDLAAASANKAWFACKICAEGTFQSQIGATQCDKCPPGSPGTRGSAREDFDSINDCQG